MAEPQYPKHPFLLSVPEVEKALDTHIDNGLSTNQVPKLQEQYGENELDVGNTIAWYTIFIRQLCNAMVLVLIFAMALSFGVKDWVEAGVLAAVIILNVGIGFWQEYRAEKKMDALRALSSPSASVLRDGKTSVIPNAQVVPGDIILLKMGDTVPADLRIFEAMNLTCDESSLTGEAEPVEKITTNDIVVPGTEKPALSEGDLGIGDRINIAYATTIVRKGRGRGIVIATGMKTEVGKIAASTNKKQRKAGRSMSTKHGHLQPVKGAGLRTWDFIGKFLGLTEGTPLQIKLSKLAYILFFCAIFLAIIVFAVNKFNIPTEVILYAISTGIAIIPESLVAVLTMTMVVATAVMRKANVVVRDLSALEALGGVTNICSDKTGTLTQGAMIVKKAWLPPSSVYTVRDSTNPNNPTEGKVTFSPDDTKAKKEEKERDYDQERTTQAIKFDVPEGEKEKPMQPKASEMDAEVTPDLRLFLHATALCNLATVRYDEEAEGWKTTGEPTEIAIQVFAHRFDHGKKSIEGKGWKQVAEFPFDSSIKRMSVVYNAPKDNELGYSPENSIVFTKGAVERVLDLCSHIGTGDTQQPMSEEVRDRILDQMTDFASQGQRVLAVAYKPWDGEYSAPDEAHKGDDSVRAQVEDNLVLLGLVGIYDPPRRETTGSISTCAEAGIKVHMLTGDHPETAKAIAREIGIIPRNLGVLPAGVAESAVMKATDFDKLSDEEIDNLQELPLVIARCAPETKTKMIEALRRRGAFMAMTGDGVNDAPSLSRADVGIAMGSGSDVAKSAAKIVLTDDKFNSIVAAIQEGRRMFENIQKFILHLLSSNVGEVILLIAGLGFRDQDGFSVFPISPLAILWINMVTSSFPAFGLSKEPASREVMRKPPHDRKRGVFSNQILWDMIVYGILMGTCTLMTFIIVVYGKYGGDLGKDCNRGYNDTCIPVFRARAAVFALLTWLILLSAWEFKSIRRSMFRLDPDNHKKFAVFHDLWSNKFLFWAVLIGLISVFPTVYIPGLNRNVFKHTHISWEWGVIIGMSIVYVVGIECWKAVKRHTGILDDHKVPKSAWSQGDDGGKRERTMSFSLSRSFGRTKSFLARTMTSSTAGNPTADDLRV
ncbi:hypothetical protein B0T13DRAFT_167220 [Neurospora crassa]|nr:hypothetical protein B0T13DRAFT_167220 [Neurospora crassa]